MRYPRWFLVVIGLVHLTVAQFPGSHGLQAGESVRFGGDDGTHASSEVVVTSWQNYNYTVSTSEGSVAVRRGAPVRKNLLWTSALPNWSRGQVAVAGGRVYVMSEAPLGEPPRQLLPVLTCLDHATGRVVWQQEVNHLPATAFERQSEAADLWRGEMVRQATMHRSLFETRTLAAQDRLPVLAMLKRDGWKVTFEGTDPVGGEADSQVRDRRRQLVERYHLNGSGWQWSQDHRHQPPVGLTAPAPVSDGRSVWVVTGHGAVASYDCDGVCRWLQVAGGDADSDVEGVMPSPILVDGRLVVSINQRCRAYDADTGTLLWETPTPWSHPRAGGTPTVLHQSSVTLLCSPGGTVLNVADGRVMASGIGYQGGGYRMAHDGQNTLFFANHTDDVAYEGEQLVGRLLGRRGLLAVRLRIGADGDQVRTEVRWTRPELHDLLAAPVFHCGRLYCRNATGLYVIDAQNGGVRQEIVGTGRGGGHLLVAGSHLYDFRFDGSCMVYVVTDRGLMPLAENRLFAGDDIDGQVLSIYGFAARNWPLLTPAAPTVADGSLLVRSCGTLFCLAESGSNMPVTETDLPAGAMDAILKAGIEDLELLERFLTHDRPILRLTALRRIGAVGPNLRCCGPVAVRLLLDDCREVRRAAFDAMMAIEADDAASLTSLLTMVDGRGSLPSEAVRALGFFGPVAGQARPALVRSFLGGDPETVYWAGWALGRMGGVDAAVIGTAAERIQESRAGDSGALAAARLLAGAGDAGLAVLVQISQHGQGRSFAVLATALGESGHRHVGKLLEMLDGKNLDGAVRALTWLGDRPVGPIRKLLRRPDDRRRYGGCQVLRHIGPSALPAWPELQALLRDRDQKIATAALEALVPLVPLQRELVLGLLDDAAWRDRAVELACRGGLQDALPKLVMLLAGDDADLRGLVVRELAHFKAAAAPALAALQAMLGRNEAIWDVLRTLTAMGEAAKDDVAAVQPHLAAADPEIRKAAADYMRGVKANAQPAVDGLVALLDESRWDIRRAAYDALRQLTLGETQVRGVMRIARNGRPEAVILLGRLGADARMALPMLRDLGQQHEDKKVRRYAAEAITLIEAE